MKDPQPILAIWLLHHWLERHVFFSNWSSEVLKTSQTILFHKQSGYKKGSFWKFQRQSWQLKCFIIDWCIAIHCQIGVLKSPKRLKTVFSTSSVGTRNTAFEWSTGNLENLKNVKCRICDQNWNTINLRLEKCRM